MGKSNFERMIQMAEEVFDTKSDPNQLDITQEVLEGLAKIHPATRSEFSDENGPAVWILIIPTTAELMNQFIAGKISEQELYERTKSVSVFESIYLCSAMVLDEYRGKGIAKRMTMEMINSIRNDHPIQSLFVWPFSEKGDKLAEVIARESKLPLLKRLH